MHILLLGGQGLLGTALADRLRKANMSCTIPDHSILDDPLRSSFMAFVWQWLLDYPSGLVINASRLDDPDLCEPASGWAHDRNVAIPGILATVCAATSRWLIHFTSNQVFDREFSAGHLPQIRVNPDQAVNICGKSLALGEHLVLGWRQSVIIRTGTLFGPGQDNFVRQVISQIRQGNTISLPSDCWDSPAYTPDVARATLFILEQIQRQQPLERIYHAASAYSRRSSPASLYSLAKTAVECAQLDSSLVKQVTIRHMSAWKVQRSGYAHLVASPTTTLPAWEESLTTYVQHELWSTAEHTTP